MIVLIGKVTKDYNFYGDSIQHYIKNWLCFMLEERRIDMNTYNQKISKFISQYED